MRTGQIAVFLVTLSCGPVAWAQKAAAPAPQSAAAVLQAAQRSSGDVEQLRAALRNPDASVRASTFMAMAASDNPSLISLAIEEGHAIADPVLRNLAARAAFREVKTLVPVPVTQPTGTILEQYNQVISYLTITVDQYDMASGAFSFSEHGRRQGQVSGSRLAFVSDCSGNFDAVEGTWLFEGTVTCNSGSIVYRDRVRIAIR